MKIVLIHGISQESHSAETLLANWRQVITEKDPGLLDGIDVQMAYYGTELASWTSRGQSGTTLPMGFDVINKDEIEFIVSALEQTAVEQAVPESAIEREINLEPMNSWIGRRLVGLIRLIESASPLKGGIALQVIKQAYIYLANENARDAVDALVRPFLGEKQLIVVSHSLGTVVAFRLLREISKARAASAEVPLLITLGSPLGLDAVKAKLGPPRAKPACVERWANFYDPSDFVALGKDLNGKTFAAGIENFGDVDNTTANAHGISGYLSDARVLGALRDALR